MGGCGVAAVVVVAWFARPRSVVVDMIVVRPQVIRATIDEPALTRVARHREVVAPISGQVTESRVRAGDSVTAGDILATMHAAPLDPRSRAEAVALADAAAARRREANAVVRQAVIAVDDARRARIRSERLVGAGGVAPRDLEAAYSAESLSLRALEGARSREEAARDDLRRVQAVLRPTTGPDVVNLRAAMTGRVLRLHEEHERVVAAGTTLMEIGDLASAELVMEVLSSDALAVKADQRVVIRLPAGDSTEGRVTRVEPAAFAKVSPLGIEEQRVRVVVRFAAVAPLVGDRFELPASIITWERADALAVPTTALVPVDSGWGVFVVRGGRAQLTQVSRGHLGARAVEVLSGISVGDTLVLFPDARIRQGARVQGTDR
jgi:HlyD family secretion protein